MSNLAYDTDRTSAASADEISQLNTLRPVPRISIQAFCETEAVAKPIERAGDDRRMAKAHLKVHMGGIETALSERTTLGLEYRYAAYSGEDFIAGLGGPAGLVDVSPSSHTVRLGLKVKLF